MTFSFTITHQDKNSRARAGIIKTPHGKLETPYLIPVATSGYIRAITPKDIAKLKIPCLLANTYHLHCKPSEKIIKKKGGLHKYMKFPKIIFTDSGGFQAFSLGIGRETGGRKIGFFTNNRKVEQNTQGIAKVTERGVTFNSIYDNSKKFIDSKISMQIQSDLGSDIIMAFDECTSATSSRKYIEESMHRSHRWEKLSLKYRDKKQALYGIIHGGWFKDLRLESAKVINSLPFDGIAIGGSLGSDKKSMYEVLDYVIPELDDRPRHMLGIGWVDDLFECVERGMDTFDCVETTRVARHGYLFISPKSGGNKKNKFRLSIRKSFYEKDKRKIDPTCKCELCKKYTRSQTREMYKAKSPEYYKLATIHNITFMLNLMEKIRESIKKSKFSKLKKEWIN
ncbi:MAG: tRNA guanosine(34) transglycosylase Tgt [Nanoarchaeota archaeon]